MEPKGSLLCSQEPTGGPCPQQDQSINSTPSYFSKVHLNNIHLPTFRFISEPGAEENIWMKEGRRDGKVETTAQQGTS
jgi:hypothetical protein